MSTINKIKISILLIIIITAIAVGIFSDTDFLQLLKDLKQFSASHPIKASIYFFLIFLVIKFTFLPMSSVSVIAGNIFNPIWGVIISIISITISSVIMFLLARYLGSDFVKKFVENKYKLIKKYNKKLEENGFLTVLFFRVIPTLPLAAVNLGLGLSRVSLMNFTLATIIGVAPGVTLLAKAGQYLGDWSNPKLYIYLGLYFLMLIIVILISYKRRKKNA
ncbi:MAG: TVP38/TMEM64 family protein [Minisyncoccales bacterium]